MDAPHQPDGPPVRDGKPYSRIAHLADDDMVRPFMAVGAVLQGAGLSAPAMPAFDLDKGLLLVEDLGDRAFGARDRRRRIAGRAVAGRGRCADRAARRAGACKPAPPGWHRLHAAAARSRRVRDRDRAAARLVLAGARGRACARRRARRVRRAVGPRARPPARAARRLVPARLSLAQPDLAARAPGHRAGSASSISRMRSTSISPSTWCRCCRMRA